ncbi:MAG: NUDIX hydrolase [Candidatus Omnitrophota bacterium]
MVNTRREVSAGGVVVRHKQLPATDNVIIETIVAVRGNGKIYCLPKGHIEPGEALSEAAKREVKEETGVETKLIKKINHINYWFYVKEENIRIFKTVHFYLLKYLSGNLEDHDDELEKVDWIDINKADGLLTFKSEKEIMQRAKGLIRDELF